MTPDSGSRPPPIAHEFNQGQKEYGRTVCGHCLMRLLKDCCKSWLAIILGGFKDMTPYLIQFVFIS